ncbi:MAG: hypothetical protein AAGM22_04680, partial [Acidobacteriota bacterium]
QGDYIYADLCSSQIWFANADDGWMPLEWSTSQSFITTFGEDEAGEFYLSSNGTVYALTSAEQSNIFADGFEQGNTSAWTAVFP